MSKVIDNGIVKLNFDSKQFNESVKESRESISNLKKDLDSGELNRNFSLSKIENELTNISDKFSNLGIVGMTALNNITNSAINAGKKIASAFTIDPIKTGFNEYETQINAVQTILANTSSKGTSLDDVNNALDELNTYADKTIYNFTEMTRNIGTFTAAGVDLETSVNAIQGIANLAAVSGSTSQQASNAMYQLSQALSSGTVKLQDWNSVVNAGMGGEVFQNALKETARLHKIAIDEMIENEGSFRETLQKGWLTSEILTETLKKFTTSGVNEYLSQYCGLSAETVDSMRKQALATDDTAAAYKDMAKKLAESSTLTENQIYELLNMSTTAEDAATKVKTFTQLMDTLKEAAQSGWTQTWEIMVGDFEEAKVLFTEISDTFSTLINESSNARNSLLEGATASGWSELQKLVADTGISFDEFQNKLKETAKQHGVTIDEFIEQDGSLEKTLGRGWLTGDVISDALDKFVNSTSSALAAANELGSGFLDLEDVVYRVMIKGEFGNGADRVKALTDAGYDYATVQDLVNRTIAGEKINYDNLSDAQLENIGYTEEQIAAIRELSEQAKKSGTPINELINNISKPSGRELIIDSFRNALKGLITTLDTLKTAWTEIFPPITQEQLYSVIEKIHDLSAYLNITDETADKLKRTFRGLFAVIDLVRTIMSSGLQITLKIISAALGNIDLSLLDVTAAIGDAAYAFRNFCLSNDTLIQGFSKIIDCIGKTCRVVYEWIEAFIMLPEVQSGLTAFKSVVIDSLRAVGDYFSEGITRISDFISRISEIDSISMDNIDEILKDFSDNVIGYFFSIGDKASELKEIFKNIGNNISGCFNSAVAELTNIKNTIFTVVGDIADKFGSQILGASVAIGFGASLVAFSKKMSEAFDVVGSLKDGALEVLENLSGVLKQYSFDLKATGLIKIAGAIAILAGAIFILSLIEPSKLWGAVGALAVLAAALVGIGALLSIIPQGRRINVGALEILSLAGSMMIIIEALKRISELDSDDIWGNIGKLSALFVAITGFSTIFNALSSKFGSGKGAITMITLSLSLIILAQAIKSIGEIDTESFGKAGLALLAFTAALAGVCLACKNIKPESLISMLIIIADLYSFIDIINHISKMDTNMIVRSIGRLIAVFAMFGVLMTLSSKSGKHAVKGGASILMMSGAMVIMSHAMRLLSDIDQAVIKDASYAIASLMTLFAGIIIASAAAGQNAAKAGVMLILMSGAIGILAAVIAGLSLIDPDGLKRGTNAIIAMGLMFSVLVGVSKLATSATKSIAALAAAVGVLSIAIGVLSLIDQDGMLNAVIAMSVVIGAFTALVGVSKFAGSNVSTIGALAITVAAFSAILWGLSQLPIDASLSAAAGMGILMLALSGSMFLISKAGSMSLSAAAPLLAISVFAIGLTALLGLLESANVTPSIETAGSVSVLAIALSAACFVLSKVGVLAKAAFIGIGVFAALIAVITGMLWGFGELMSNVDGMDVALDLGVAVFGKIGEAIGALIGGIGTGLFAGLPAIATYLSDFMVNLAPFLTIVKMIDFETLACVAELCAILALLSVTALLDTLLTSLGGGSTNLASFGEQLTLLGDALCSYAQSVSGLTKKDLEAISRSVHGTAGLADVLTSLPRSGGVLQALAGEQSWETFTAGLVGFGGALVSYAETVDSMTDAEITAIDRSVEAAAGLNDLLNAVPNSGGVLADLVGDNTWSTFSEGLSGFGSALVSYAGSVTELTDVKIGSITRSITAARSLNDLLKAMPNSGGALAAIVGDNTWETFTAGLCAFGSALNGYGESVSLLTSPRLVAISNSISAAKSLNELLKTVDNSGGVAAWFAGDNTWATFGEGLEEFAETLKAFGEVAVEIDNDSITKSGAALKYVVDALSVIPEKGNKSNIEKFGDGLTSIGSALKSYSENIAGMDFSKVSSAAIQLKKMIDTLKSADDINPDAVSKLEECLTSLSEVKISYGGATYKTAAKADTQIKKLKKSANEYERSTVKITRASSNMNDALAESGEELGVVSENSGIGDTLSVIGSNIMDVVTGKKDITDGIEEVKSSVIDPLIGNLGFGNLTDSLMGDFDLSTSLSKYGIDIGSDFGDGIIDGIESEISDPELKAVYKTAKKEYDQILEAYKNNKITQSEYDKQYTNLLKKYTSVQTQVVKYGQSEIAEYIKDSFDSITDEFESEIKDIQGKIDSFADKMQGSFEDTLTYKTKGDEYNKQIGEYENQLDELNKKRDNAVSLYGEDSFTAKNYQKQIDALTLSITKYKDSHSDSDDDTIIGVEFTDKIKQSTKEINEYADAVAKLKGRDISSAMVDSIAGMDREKGLATVNYLNSLSDKELAAVNNNWAKNTEASKKLAAELYSREVEDSMQQYVTNITGELNSLPDTAKSIGVDMAKGLALGFTEETEATLAEIGASGENITEALKKIFGIHSPSRVFRDEIGANLASGLEIGFIDKMNSISDNIIKSVPTNFKMEYENDIDTGKFRDAVAPIDYIVDNGYDIQPTVSPVLDLSNITSGADEMYSILSDKQAVKVSSNIVAKPSNEYKHLEIQAAFEKGMSNAITAISNKISTMSDKFNEFGNSISNMHIVMDSGALVGQISSGLDSSLGSATTMKRRGV